MGDPAVADLPGAAVGVGAAQPVDGGSARQADEAGGGQRGEGIRPGRIPVGRLPQPPGHPGGAGRCPRQHPGIGRARGEPRGRPQPRGGVLGPVDDRQHVTTAPLPRRHTGESGGTRGRVTPVPHRDRPHTGPPGGQQPEQRAEFRLRMRKRTINSAPRTTRPPLPVPHGHAHRTRPVPGGDSSRLVGEEHPLPRVVAAPRERPQRGRTVQPPVQPPATMPPEGPGSDTAVRPPVSPQQDVAVPHPHTHRTTASLPPHQPHRIAPRAADRDAT